MSELLKEEISVKNFLVLFTVILVSISVGGISVADTILKDPNIPHGEEAVYRVTTGDEISSSTTTVRITEKDGIPVYEISSESDSLERVMLLSRESMNILFVHTISKSTDGIIDTKTELVENNLDNDSAAKDTVKMMNMSSLNHALRGFPFEGGRAINLTGMGGSRFIMYAKVVNREEVKTPAGEFNSYKIELGIRGGFGLVAPKTYLWFSVDKPHFLVKYIGSLGFPGTPKTTIEIMSYSN